MLYLSKLTVFSLMGTIDFCIHFFRNCNKYLYVMTTVDLKKPHGLVLKEIQIVIVKCDNCYQQMAVRLILKFS